MQNGLPTKCLQETRLSTQLEIEGTLPRKPSEIGFINISSRKAPQFLYVLDNCLRV